jgi:hypothetical protein
MIESTQQKIEELNRLRRQARGWRVGGAAVCAAVSAVFLFVIWSKAERLFTAGPTHDEFVAELKTGLQRDVVPQVKTLTVHTVNELVPRVQVEVVKLQTRVPELTGALTAELTLFQKNVPARIDKALGASFTEVIQERQAKIRQLYPDLTDENVRTITASLSKEGALRMDHVAQRVIEPYTDVMTKLVVDLNHIRDTEPAPAPGREPAWELATLCANMLQDEIRRTVPMVSAPLLAVSMAEPQP